MSDVLDVVRAQRPERPILDAATRGRLRARATGELGADGRTGGEAPVGPPSDHPDELIDHGTLVRSRGRDDRLRGPRWLTVAAGLVIVVGGLWWLQSSQTDAPDRPADEAPIATTPDANPVTAPTAPPPTPVVAPGRYPLDDLGLLAAARRISLGGADRPHS